MPRNAPREKRVEITVGELKRMLNSPDGNPAWMVVASDGRQWRTASDHAVGYAVDDSLVGLRVELTVRAGQVVDVARG